MPAETPQTPPSSWWPQGSDSPHVSPVLAGVESSRMPVPSPVCADCPASVWYATLGGLRCFCKIFSRLSWGTEEFDVTRDPVMACDGREMAIQQMLAEAEKQEG